MQFFRTYRQLLQLFLFTILLVFGRMVWSGSFVFLFIPWNLLLALLPLYFSYRLAKAKSPSATWAYLLLWLLFFPNSAYVITDLFHLRQRPDMPQWFDLLILFTAALNSLIAGLLSLKEVERCWEQKPGSRYTPLIHLAVFLLCGYGIYLGRYLRWNSWDVVTDPLSLLGDIMQEIIHPFRNRQCWLLSVFFGGWLYILYRYFKKIIPC